MRAAGGLLGEGLAGVVGIVADVHRTVGDVVTTVLPTPARPVVAATSTMAAGVFGTLRVAHRWTPVLASELLAVTPVLDHVRARTNLGGAAHSVVNGLWGHHIADRHPGLAIPMAVRVADADVPLTPEGLAAAFPDAGPSVVVFLHGLMESERQWWPGGEPPRGSFGDRLREDLSTTAVYVRYNTGHHISDNGLDLAELLDGLVAAWPVEVTRIDLVGHSMGGLVAVSACHAAEAADRPWVALVDTVVTLGTPHLGAPLEKGVHALDWGLRRLRLTEPYARVLGSRSAGIKDLRHGATTPHDWPDDEVLLPGALAGPNLVDHISYAVLAATISTDPEHPAGRIVGDGLVRRPSATGRGRVRHIDFGGEHAVVGGLDHLELLHHDQVYELLRVWLDPQAAGEAEQV